MKKLFFIWASILLMPFLAHAQSMCQKGNALLHPYGEHMLHADYTCSEDYASLYDPADHIPEVAVEFLTKDALLKASKVRDGFNWYKDPKAQDTPHTDFPTTWVNPRWDRVGLVPIDDTVDRQKVYRSSNAVLMTPSLHEGKWTKIEERLRDLTTSRDEETTVITGIIKSGQGAIPRMGRQVSSDKIAIPYLFYKFIFFNKAKVQIGIICENDPSQNPTCQQYSVDKAIVLYGNTVLLGDAIPKAVWKEFHFDPTYFKDIVSDEDQTTWRKPDVMAQIYLRPNIGNRYVTSSGQPALTLKDHGIPNPMKSVNMSELAQRLNTF